MKGLLNFLGGKRRRQEVWVNTLMKNLQRALEEQRFAFAVRSCEELLAVDPTNLDAWLIRGHLAWKHENNPALALKCYRKVLILGGYDSSSEPVAQARACLAQLLAPEP
ncbi:MAG: hypothetical protein NZ869_11405 [Thermoanaerobaculum sp.]|nr:hypothetical protein [Thermoanaerobaculum sp.]MCX7896076.1 hypothetical protein [Thermoanaerobaculum sp.]MDW7966505.1 hypothetical protein [Thermoanaerobaculum sp.]